MMERLWPAAYCFHPEGSPGAKTFVTDRLRRILEGDVGRVIGGLKQMVTKQKLRGSRRRQLFVVIGYLPVAKLWHRRLAGGFHGQERRFRTAVFPFATGCYLQRHRRFICYDALLAAGCPIGSGVAEGACRHLVKDRMELTGMRWQTDSAQGMLDLRAMFLNDG